jgi:hypothetical protein
MNHKIKIVVLCAFLAAFMAVPMLMTAHAMTLEEAIATAPQGTEKGQIDSKAAPGFLGIPGAPDISLIIGFFGRSGSVGYFQLSVLLAALWRGSVT